jgi:hypothetical protein
MRVRASTLTFPPGMAGHSSNTGNWPFLRGFPSQPPDLERPKVAGLVYVSAVAPDKGESVFGLITSVPTPVDSELRPDKSGFLKLTPKGIAEDFAQDLSAKEIAVLTATQVEVQTGDWRGSRRI